MTALGTKPDSARKSIVVSRMIWGALSVSTLIYYGVAHVVARQVPAKAVPESAENALAGMAVVCFVLAFMVSKWLARKLKAQPFVPFMVRLALLEAVALYGFVLAVAFAEPRKMLPYLAASLLGFLLSFPSKNFFDKLSS